jgi:hypothetical protein
MKSGSDAEKEGKFPCEDKKKITSAQKIGGA